MKDWRNKAKRRVKQKKQGSTYKLVVGPNCFRILPNANGMDHAPYYEYLVHREVGPDKKYVRCGKDLDDNGNRTGECWICDEIIPKLERSGSRAKKAIAANLKAREQFVVQVAEYDPEEEKLRGPLMWFVSTGGAKSLSVAIMGLLATSKRRYDDPKKGYNLNIERTGTGPRDTRYGTIEADEERSKVPSSIINAIKPFDEAIREYSEDEQRAAYYGEKERDFDDDEEDDDVATKKKHSKKDETELKRKKKSREDEDEEEEEEVEEDEEEEEEEDDEDEDEPKKKSKKGKSKSKKSKKDEDEEDDEEEEEEDDEEEEEEEEEDDDEDDDEDDEPKKKSKKSKKPAKKSKKDEDDDEDEEEEDEGEDEEEEDEDEDEEEEEDEDDEPKKKSKKPVKKAVKKPVKKGKKK